MRYQTSVQRIQSDIETLAGFTSTPNRGVSRFSFSPEDRLARDYIKTKMLAANLSVSEDAAGTVVGRRPGLLDNGPVVMVGSHFDSVLNGGAFDGPAGVVAGLEIARAMNENKLVTQYPIEFVAMIEEEGGRFGAGLFGSRAMAGKLVPNELELFKDDAGISMAEAMRSFGLDPARIDSAVRSADQLKAFFELHIEQGPVLEKAGVQVGIVEVIVGIEQWEIIVAGRPDHAGTTPMDLRADALVAAAKLVMLVNDLARKAGAGTVATIGKMQVLPGAGNVVPGLVSFSVDIRSADTEKIRLISDGLRIVVQQLPNEYPGICTRMNPKLSIAPTQLSTKIADIFETEAICGGISTRRMVSGAGHDAMVMAGLTDVGLIFVPSRSGRSHCPEEWTDYEQLKTGTDLMLQVVLQTAGSDLSAT